MSWFGVGSSRSSHRNGHHGSSRRNGRHNGSGLDTYDSMRSATYGGTTAGNRERDLRSYEPSHLSRSRRGAVDHGTGDLARDAYTRSSRDHSSGTYYESSYLAPSHGIDPHSREIAVGRRDAYSFPSGFRSCRARGDSPEDRRANILTGTRDGPRNQVWHGRMYVPGQRGWHDFGVDGAGRAGRRPDGEDRSGGRDTLLRQHAHEFAGASYGGHRQRDYPRSHRDDGRAGGYSSAGYSSAGYQTREIRPSYR
ncbi:hypothetical protein H2203_007430 [Taxawa tesnikishii (nom. ined.)]|nr:hypothetical protein H2203_007430 [Dothideales sp. JES 119]